MRKDEHSKIVQTEKKMHSQLKLFADLTFEPQKKASKNKFAHEETNTRLSAFQSN